MMIEFQIFLLNIEGDYDLLAPLDCTCKSLREVISSLRVVEHGHGVLVAGARHGVYHNGYYTSEECICGVCRKDYAYCVGAPLAVKTYGRYIYGAVQLEWSVSFDTDSRAKTIAISDWAHNIKLTQTNVIMRGKHSATLDLTAQAAELARSLRESWPKNARLIERLSGRTLAEFIDAWKDGRALIPQISC